MKAAVPPAGCVHEVRMLVRSIGDFVLVFGLVMFLDI
jgi:hypothetical protein